MWTDDSLLGRVYDVAAEHFGDAEGLTFEGRRWSFRAVKVEVDRAAKALMHAGVAPGDRVCLWLPNCPELIFAFFAAAKVGAVPVPINSRFRTRDMAYVLAQSDASTLVAAGRREWADYPAMVREVVPEIDRRAARLESAELPHLRRVIALEGGVPEGSLDWSLLTDAAEVVSDEELEARAAAVEPDALAFIMYTSGTTGFPKGVMHDHRLLRSVFDMGLRLAATPADVILDYLPLFHMYAFYVGLALSPLTGARHLLMGHFEPGEALSLIEEEKATMLHGFELHFRALLDHPDFARRDLRSLRTGVLAAGTRSAEATARRFQDVMPSVSGWGMTEVGVGFTSTYVDSPFEVRTTMSGWRQYGCDVRIVDPTTRAPLSAGEIGEIAARGYTVTRGYYNKPEETAAVLAEDGWFYSGDTGVLREDGCLRFLGRYKDLIRVGGENVDPAEVELALAEHEAVAQAAAVGAPDERLGEVVVAFVLPSEGASPSPGAIIDFCRERIASFKAPRHVFLVEGFPLTETGKIKKSALVEEAVRRLDAGG